MDNENRMNILAEHKKLYPLMTVKDAVKLIYQSEFGGGHMITNAEKSLEMLQEELNEISKYTIKSRISTEYIGNQKCRFHLNFDQQNKLTPELLNRIFIASANNTKGSVLQFENKLNNFVSLCENNKQLFSVAETREYIDLYIKKHKNLYPPISHSDIYKNNYAPHYRVIDEQFVRFLDVFCEIDALAQRKERVLIAIDGKSGSGKSGLANHIAKIFNCNIFHMDDFFLTPNMRTMERLNEIGGNVDYKRFYEQVLKPLVSGQSFFYEIYDCKSNLFKKSKVINKKINIIEGVYSQHPFFQNPYDCTIFLTLDSKIQKTRIFDRNGEALLKRFENEWIPLENAYFQQLQIMEQSTFLIDTSEFY